MEIPNDGELLEMFLNMSNRESIDFSYQSFKVDFKLPSLIFSPETQIIDNLEMLDAFSSKLRDYNGMIEILDVNVINTKES